MEQALPAELGEAIARAGSRARTSELRLDTDGSDHKVVPDELAEFVRTILSDGTFARAAEKIGQDEPDLATV